MITFNKKQTESVWVDYDEDVKFLIRPFPVSARALRPSGDFNMIDILIKQAMYVVQDWKGIKDQNGDDVKYTDENKEMLFNFSEALIEWACVESKKLNDDVVNISEKKT